MPAKKIKTRICPTCNKEETGPSRYLWAEHCSKECWRKRKAGQHLKTGREIRCRKCSRFFYARGSYIAKGNKYCSEECYRGWVSENRIPEIICICGKKFQPRSRARIFCSKKCSKTGGSNPQWKGDNVTYESLHSWIRRNYGTPDGCEACGTLRPGAYYEWANITRSYRKNIDDFLRLCKSCHVKFDRKKHKGEIK